MGAYEAAKRISREMGKGNSAQRKWGTLDFDDVREVLAAYRSLQAIYDHEVTDEQRDLLGVEVIVENPNGSATWRGKGIAIAAHPSIVIEEESGTRRTLPLAWARAHGVHHHHWMLGQSTPCACGVYPPWAAASKPGGHWVYAVRDADGEVYSWGGTSYDSHPLRTAEEALATWGHLDGAALLRAWQSDPQPLEWSEFRPPSITKPAPEEA